MELVHVVTISAQKLRPGPEGVNGKREAGATSGVGLRAGAELGGRITNQTTLMSAPILDPSLPADNSLITSGELRGQFQAIADKLDELINTLNA